MPNTTLPSIWTFFSSRLSTSLIAIMAAGLLLSACARKEPSGDVVARVGDTLITKQQFEAELQRQANRGASVGSPAEREAVLKEMIRLEAFYNRAKAAGYDRDPELTLQFKKMVAAKLEEDEWKKMPEVKRPELGEVDLFFKANKDEFTTPEKFNVAIIFLKVPSKAGEEQVARVQAKAEEIRSRALADSGREFGLLAQENSEDQSTRYRGGDCGWISRENRKYRWDKQVFESLFALEKSGDVTDVIRTLDGFYIGKLIERKPQETAPLELVRERIEHQLIAAKQKQRREEFDRTQLAASSIEINQSVLKSIEPPSIIAKKQDVVPPGVPAE